MVALGSMPPNPLYVVAPPTVIQVPHSACLPTPDLNFKKFICRIIVHIESKMLNNIYEFIYSHFVTLRTYSLVKMCTIYQLACVVHQNTQINQNFSSIMAALFSLTYLLLFFELAASSHFRGGIVQWRPLNNNPMSFNGLVSQPSTAIILLLGHCSYASLWSG